MHELVNFILSEIRSAVRFRWYGMFAAWGVCALGWGFAGWLPDIYQADARIYVDTSSVLEPVLGSQIVTPDVEAQLAYVREALLGREQLEKVVAEVGIGRNAVTQLERERVLASLANGIQIRTAVANRATQDTVYSITYRNPNRDVAVGVVRAILNTFVNDTIGANRSGEATAEQFLQDRVAEYEQRLQKAEQALADFKRQHADRLPGAEGDYFARMQNERRELAQAYRDLRIAESKRDQLQKQLDGQATVVPGQLGTTQELPANSLDARIRDRQAELDAALLIYTEKHPDVINLREILARLKEQRAEQLRALGIEDTDQELIGLDANPVYQALKIALNESEVEIATLQADIDERQKNVDDLQGLIDEVPEVEAELARLNRDYDVIYEQYLDIVRSRETQDLTRKATDTDQIDFRVIDAPGAGLEPVAPDRYLIIGAAFVAALMIGGALSWACAQLWPVFGNMRALRTYAELPVLGAVTHAWDDKRRAENRHAAISYAMAFVALCGACVLLLGLEKIGFGPNTIMSFVL